MTITIAIFEEIHSELYNNNNNNNNNINNSNNNMGACSQWNFSSRIQLDISQVSALNEYDIELSR